MHCAARWFGVFRKNCHVTRSFSVPVKLSRTRPLLAPFRYRLSPVHALLIQVKLTPSPFVWSFSLKLPVTRTVPSHYANDFFVVLRCIEPVSRPTRYANGYSWLYYDAAIASPPSRIVIG